MMVAMQSWVEKYRPQTLSDVAGNAAALSELRLWAESWDKGKPQKNAVILAGKAGTGKTSAALALAQDMHWQVIEMNASDARNADAVRRIATRGARFETFLSDGSYVRASEGGRKLIVLDEADNLFGTEDRGGIGAIVETIEKSGHPIVLIVNDLYELTRRSSSLKRLCKTIKFQRIHAATVKSVLKKVCKAEGVTVSEDMLEHMATKSQGDLRSAVNDLQLVSAGKTDVGIEDASAIGSRDTEGNVYDALLEIFRSGSVEKARKSTTNLDESPETLILWIDENMPVEYRRPDDLSRGYSALSKSDVYLGRVRRRQNYGLWSYAKDMMTGGVAAARQGSYAGGVYRFPTWLMKMSRSSSLRKTIDSLAGKLGSCMHTSKRVIVNDVIGPFRQLFRNDSELRLNAAIELNLDAKEIAFLLGEEEDSHPVKHLMEAVGKLKSAESEGSTGFERFAGSENQSERDE